MMTRVALTNDAHTSDGSSERAPAGCRARHFVHVVPGSRTQRFDNDCRPVSCSARELGRPSPLASKPTACVTVTCDVGCGVVAAGAERDRRWRVRLWWLWCARGEGSGRRRAPFCWCAGGRLPFPGGHHGEGSMGNTERTWTGYKIGMLFSLD
jgi:hypothetical protein